MTSEKYNEILEKLEYEKGKWVHGEDIIRVLKNDGVGVYPSWKNVRFLFDESGIYVKHGKVKPYGARIMSTFSISGDYKTLYVSYVQSGIIGIDDGLGNRFRQPRIGDKIVITGKGGKVYSDSTIIDIKRDMNSLILELTSPISKGKISYFDPSVFNNSEHLLHSDLYEGMYFSFESNEGKRNHKEYGLYHEHIRVKHIKEFDIQVGDKRNGKSLAL